MKRPKKNARLALNKAPSEFCKKIAPFESKRIPAHFSLIESLAKQSKEFSEEANKLRRDITAFCTYLSGHAFAFFSTAEDLAQFAPAVARDFITVGRLIQEADSESQTMTSRDTEAAACKAVGDKSCLLEIARYEEEQLNKENSYWADQVANSYVDAGDFDSAERIFANFGIKHGGECFRFSRIFGIDRMIIEGEFARANRWLADWLQCRADNLPNYETGFGEGGNLWSDLAVAYASLSRAQTEKGMIEEAQQSAVNSLLLAIETENTWRVEYLPYRAVGLGEAYGSAYGAFIALGRRR